MDVALSLLVLRCSDIEASKRFYEALGLSLRAEQHRTGPVHWSCRVGGVVLELYPAEQRTPSVARLGFAVEDLQGVLQKLSVAGASVVDTAAPDRAVGVDPDGNRVELTPAIVAGNEALWSVWRQDDNGNRTVISRGHAREEAEQLVRAFEARGHKQLYWASADDVPPSPR